MKTQHTPGPWIVVDDEIIDDDGNVIADVTQFNQWNTTEGMVTEDMPWGANARLMAAAPEMYDLLKDIYPMIGQKGRAIIDKIDAE